MRLIDGDRLCNDLLDRWNMAEARKEELIKAIMADIVTPIVASQPTIEERKTGKWEIYVISPFDGEGCRCSECKYEGAPYWDFCPNCGADMRGELK